MENNVEREADIFRSGVRAASRDVLDYINDHEQQVGELDSRQFRAWLYAYHITAGGLDAQG